MTSAKDLSGEQRTAVEQWVGEGDQLADIQKRLMDQFGLNVTYMDTRFLVLDLGLEIQSNEEAVPEEDESTEPEEGSVLLEADPSAADSPSVGDVTVTTDELTRPGALVSGTVTFSDGKKAVWLIDEMGRLGFEPETPGYQPTEADAIAFENELRRMLDEEG